MDSVKVYRITVTFVLIFMSSNPGIISQMVHIAMGLARHGEVTPILQGILVQVLAQPGRILSISSQGSIPRR